MEIKDMYNEEFVDQVRNILAEECVAGKRVTKDQLLNRLGMDVPDDSSKRTLVGSIIGGLITLGMIEGYDSQPGIGGGFGLAGIEREKSSPTLPENFVEELQNACDKYVTGKTITSREQLAKWMQVDPTPKNLNFISIAFKNNKIVGFTSKRGKGGITRDATARITAPETETSPELMTGTG